MWIIIVATIVGFFIYLMPGGNRFSGLGGGGGGPSVAAGRIDGEPISQVQYGSALREAKVLVRMREKRWPTQQESLQTLPNYAFQQLFIGAKLKELNLDVPLETTALITRRIVNEMPTQGSAKDKFEKFVKEDLHAEGNVSEDDFYHWVTDQVGAKLLIQLYGMNGTLITDKDAEFLFQREHLSMTVEMARFPITNYTSKIVVTPEEVGQFYTNEQPNYRLPEREQVNYIPFYLTNYQSAADQILTTDSNLASQIDARIDDAYIKQDPASFKDTNGNVLSADAAKAKMKEEYRTLGLPSNVARTNAGQLLTQFFDLHKKNGPITNQLITSTELRQFADSNHLAFVTTPPFDDEHPPAEFQLPPSALLQWIGQLKATDSAAISAEDLKDLPKLANRLALHSDPVSAFLWQRLSVTDQAALANFLASPTNASGIQDAQDALVKCFNKSIAADASIYDANRFKGVTLQPETTDLMKREPAGTILAHLNRMLLDDVFPDELARGSAPDPEQQYRLIQATNGLFFVGLQCVLPSQNQPFEVVREKVAEDYRNSKAQELAMADGKKFDAAVQAGLAKGISFDDICASFEPKVKPQVLTPFSIDTKSIPEIDDSRMFRDIVEFTFENLSVGQATPFEAFQTTPPSGGFLIYYKAQTPVSDDVMRRDMPSYLKAVRDQRQMAAFSLWMGREMQMHVEKPPARDAADQAPKSSN